MKKSVSTLYGEKIMDKNKEAVIDEILYGLEKLGNTVIKGDFATSGIFEPFLLLWALKKMCLETDGNIARDRAFESIEKGLSGDKINLKENDIDYVLGVIEAQSKIPNDALKERFRPSSHAFEKLSGVNDTHTIKVPFYKLDITKDAGEIYKYVLIKNISYFRSINPKVAEIASAILKVKEGESFSDFMSGTGLTSEIVTGGKESVEITLTDNYPHAFALSALYLFLTDKKGKALYENSISEENLQSGEKADKIYVTPPYMGKILPGVKFNGMSLIDIAYVAAVKAAYTLNGGGKAVMSLTSSFAFGTKNYGEEIRKYLVENNYVSAVILLPNLYKDTNIPTLLLVLSKEDNPDILMVDLQGKEKNEEWFYYDKRFESLAPTDKAVKEIERIERERETENEISALISKEKIKENSYNLLPSLYVEKTQSEFRSISEIESDIERVLGELKDLLG